MNFCRHDRALDIRLYRSDLMELLPERSNSPKFTFEMAAMLAIACIEVTSAEYALFCLFYEICSCMQIVFN
jgi:hypothetical protein